MRNFLGLLLALIAANLHGQLAYEGVVTDANTGKPIPFVNIGIVDRGIGTITNEEGEFLLEFRPREIEKGDIIRISSLGYLPREIPITVLKEDVLKLMIPLKPEPLSLDEVILTDKEYVEVEEEVGYRNLLGQGIGYWKDSVALGGELATRIRISKGLRRLNTLFFNVLNNPSDSVRLRINIYEIGDKWGFPDKNLNQTGKNILYLLPSDRILSVIDLKPYDIWVRNDFIVSIELLGVYGSETVALSLPAGDNGRSFRRYASQGSWEGIDGKVGFWLQSTLFTDNPRKIKKQPELRRRQKSEREISGYVFTTSDVRGSPARWPRSGATISNYTSNEIVKTDEWGRYRIKVVKGDILGVSYPGMFQYMIEIDDVRNFNFRLYPTRR